MFTWSIFNHQTKFSMKKYLLPVLMLFCAGQLLAQNKLGIATYTVPAGWQSTTGTSSVVLENTTKKGGLCKITIYNTEKGAVNTAAAYLQQRKTKNAANARYTQNAKQLVKTETNGNIGFSSYGGSTVNEKELRVYFYSFTNGQESFFVELVTDNNDCITAFNQFLATLLVDPATDETSESNGSKSKAKRGRKAAPAAVPAAPAPMM
jgi:hypothetical protein